VLTEVVAGMGNGFGVDLVEGVAPAPKQASNQLAAHILPGGSGQSALLEANPAALPGPHQGWPG
jgi:hypothetical protein